MVTFIFTAWENLTKYNTIRYTLLHIEDEWYKSLSTKWFPVKRRKLDKHGYKTYERGFQRFKKAFRNKNLILVFRHVLCPPTYTFIHRCLCSPTTENCREFSPTKKDATEKNLNLILLGERYQKAGLVEMWCLMHWWPNRLRA